MGMLDQMETDEQPDLKPDAEEDALDALIESEAGDDTDIPADKAPETPDLMAVEDADQKEEDSEEPAKPDRSVPEPIFLEQKKNAKDLARENQELKETLAQNRINQARSAVTLSEPEDTELSPMEKYLEEYGEDLTYGDVPMKVHQEQKRWEATQQGKQAERQATLDVKAEQQAKLEDLNSLKGPQRTLVTLANTYLGRGDMMEVMAAKDPKAELLLRSWNALHSHGSPEERQAAQALFPKTTPKGKPDPKVQSSSKEDSTDQKLELEKGEDLGVHIPSHVDEIMSFLS